MIEKYDLSESKSLDSFSVAGTGKGEEFPYAVDRIQRLSGDFACRTYDFTGWKVCASLCDKKRGKMEIYLDALF